MATAPANIAGNRRGNPGTRNVPTSVAMNRARTGFMSRRQASNLARSRGMGGGGG